MILLPNLLIISGNARNIGKTTLANAIIRHFSQDYSIVGLKVSTLKPNEEQMHGDHSDSKPQTYFIEQETNRKGNTDTSRMLLAGATSAWYISAQGAYLEEAVSDFLLRIPSKALIVAESRTLRDIAEPSALILIERRNPWVGIKPVEDLVPLASLHLMTGPGYAALPDILSKITTDGRDWKISP